MSKKILIVTDFFEPHTSGIVTYISQLIDSLKNNNFEITVLTTRFSNKISKIENLNGVKIIRCKPFLKISRGFYSIDLVLKYIKLYKKFDIVNLHLPLVEIFPIIFFLKRKHTNINYHCLPEFPAILKLIKFYFYFFGICASLISKKTIVLSKDYFNNILFHNIIEKKIIEIPPYILLPNIYNKRNIDKNIIKIGYLGRLSDEKGLEILIEASNKLLKNKYDHELMIAGDKDDKRFQKYIKKLFYKSKNNNRIKFIGKINELDKSNFFNNLDIFILPSINSFEAFGIVQLEAMSYGIPVLASNIIGVRSIIKKTKNGFLFESKNIDDLYEKILLCNITKFNPINIRKNLEKTYNKEIFNSKIISSF